MGYSSKVDLCCAIPPTPEDRSEADKWAVPLYKDGCAKSGKLLRYQIGEVKKVVTALQAKFNRPMPSHTINAVVKQVCEHCRTATQVLNDVHARRALNLAEDKGRWAAMFASACHGGTDNAGLASNTLHPLPSHIKDFFNKHFPPSGTTPTTVHQLVDRQATANIMSGNLTVTANHIPWYSDAFMNALQTVVDHMGVPSSAALSFPCPTVVNYAGRTALAEALRLAAPPAWNDGDALLTWKTDTGAGYGLPTESAYMKATEDYVLLRQRGRNLSPHNSTQSAIGQLVAGRLGPVDGHLGSNAGVVTIKVPACDPAVDTLQEILEDCMQSPCQRLTLSQWADRQVISVDLPGTRSSTKPKVTIEPSLLEFHSTEFLSCIVGILSNDCKQSKSRQDMINYIIKHNCMHVQPMSNRLPSSGQLRAFRTYLCSDQCQYKDTALLRRVLGCIVTEFDSDGVELLSVRVRAEQLDRLPLALLWLAARCSGALALPPPGRAKLYGCSAASVDMYEAKVAEAAYSGQETAEYKKAMTRALQQRLQVCFKPSTCYDDGKDYCLEHPAVGPLLKTFLDTNRSSLAAHDLDLLQLVKDYCSPRITIRPSEAAHLGNKLLHVLQELFTNVHKDTDDYRCHLAPFYDEYRYPKIFKEGLISNIMATWKQVPRRTC